MSSPVVSSRTPIGQIINRDGTATFAFLKWMQNIGSTINVTFDSEGVYQGDIGDQATIDGRETLASIVQNISNDGVVQGPGIDFALPYLNKDTDHIADGSGSPLAGGKEAYAVLVASGPAAGQTIRFNGTDWLPVAIAISKTATISQWLRSYDESTGAFTASQPGFSDLSGSLDPSQLPADIAYTDQANVFTANQTITGDLAVSGNISSANFPPAQVYPGIGLAVSTGSAWAASIDPATLQGKLTLTTTGTSGSSTLVGNTLNIPVYTAAAQVYPAAGIGVSTGSAWTASIDPADVPRLSAANTFTQPIRTSDGASTLRLGTSGGNSFCDAIGPDPSTQSSFVFRSLSSNSSISSSILILNPTLGTINGNFTVTGTLTAGSKSFLIPHPLDETKDLIHGCLEGPEHGVFYRGEVETVEGLAQVVLPDYFEALTFPEDRSVQLTQIEDGVANFTMMRASRIYDGKFSIRTSEPSVKIAWLVMAVRRVGSDRLQVVQDKA